MKPRYILSVVILCCLKTPCHPLHESQVSHHILMISMLSLEARKHYKDLHCSIVLWQSIEGRKTICSSNLIPWKYTFCFEGMKLILRGLCTVDYNHVLQCATLEECGKLAIHF